jgi:hypothetical protein
MAACTEDRAPSATESTAASSAKDDAALETAPNQGMQALYGGTLRLERHEQVTCSYVHPYRLVWPDGFIVTSDGASITDAEGRVTAYDGKMIQVGGGLSGAPAEGPCSVAGGGTWFVSSVEARGTP